MPTMSAIARAPASRRASIVGAHRRWLAPAIRQRSGEPSGDRSLPGRLVSSSQLPETGDGMS